MRDISAAVSQCRAGAVRAGNDNQARLEQLAHAAAPE